VRNYLWELKVLGNTYKSIAESLGVSSRAIGKIVKAGRVPSNNPLYGPIRNLHRNAITQNLQAHGIHGQFVAANRRMPLGDLVNLPGKIQQIASKLGKDWNRPYNNYIKNPDAWRTKFPDTKPPHEFTQQEIEDRVKKSLSHKQKVEDAIDDEGHFTSP